MKFLLITVFSLLLFPKDGFAQIETRFFSSAKESFDKILKERNLPIETKSIKYLPSFDLATLQKEDAEMEGCDVPYRFGKSFDVSYTISDGEWQNSVEGRTWLITFESENAKSLNFVFRNLHLPKGGYLYVINFDSYVLYGPVNANNISKNGYIMTDIIPGSKASVCIFEPYESLGETSIDIKKVIHGYRPIGFDEFYGLNGSSASCNIDVACRPFIDDESKAIGLVLLSSGNELCSGSLVMSTDMSLKPYFLTAFHCIDSSKDGTLSTDEINDAGNWMFKFYH